MKRNAQYRIAMLIPIVVGILGTISVAYAGAQSAAGTKPTQHVVQTPNDTPDEDKSITVATIAGRPSIAIQVGNALQSAHITSYMIGGSRAYGVSVPQKDRDHVISILEADAQEHQYTIYIDRPKEDMGRDDGYSRVASIEGKPATTDTVFRTLDAGMIPAKMFGSRTYDIYVPEKEFDHALKLLEVDSKKQHYDIELNQERTDKYVTVASVHAKDGAPDKVSRALHMANIPVVVVCSSQSFLIRVSQENSERAFSILGEDAWKQKYGMVLYRPSTAQH